MLDNKIEIILKTEGRNPRKKLTKEEKIAQDTNDLLEGGVGIAANLPVIGEPIGQFTGIINKGTSLVKTLSAGGVAATLGWAGLAVAAVSFAYNTTKEYVQNKRQSDELQRRAGFRR
jgi:hypothetical protein